MSVSISPKSSFAPIRYQATRPWWKTLGKFAAKGVAYSQKRRHKFLKEELQPYAVKTITETTGIRNAHVLQNEISLLQVIGSFINGGRTVYEFSESLTDSLAVTDFDNTTIGDVLFPQNDIYLHFGPHPCLNIGGVQLEGFWVDYLSEEKIISIQACKMGSFSKKPIHFAKQDTVDSHPIFYTTLEQTIGNAIHTSIEQLEKQRLEQLLEMNKVVEQYRARGVEVETAAVLEAIGGPIQEDDIRRIANICFSALCFLSARPEDIEFAWPSDAPYSLVQRAKDHAESGKKSTAERVLDNDGYLKIGYVGAKFDATSQVPRLFSSGISDSEVKRILSTHPRRGYFRRQPFGPGNLDRKIVYIAPTIVNPGVKLGRGKILSVQKPDQ